MSHVPHELAEDFPGRQDDLHALRERDAHAAKLMDEYHEINRAIHRIETDVTPVSEVESVGLRKRRIALKDEISRALGAFKAG